MFSKKCVQFCLISLVFIPLIFLGSHESLAVEKKVLTWGSTATTSGLFVYYPTVAKILNEKIPEINITVRSTGGGVHNIRLLENREVDIGSADQKPAWEAFRGKGIFEGRPTDLRLLYTMMTNPVNFVVSEKSGIKDIYGLQGKPFCPGMLGSGQEKISKEVFHLLEIQPKLRPMSLADAIEAMKNEMIVGFGKSGHRDSSILDVASVMKIRVLSFSDDDIEKIVRNIIGLDKIVVPSGMYPGVGEFKTLRNDWNDWVRKDFPAELAYKIVKTIWENRSEIHNVQPMFIADKFPEISLGIKTVYMHPGAIKFYRELGYTVPKILVPPEMGEK